MNHPNSFPQSSLSSTGYPNDFSLIPHSYPSPSLSHPFSQSHPSVYSLQYMNQSLSLQNQYNSHSQPPSQPVYHQNQPILHAPPLLHDPYLYQSHPQTQNQFVSYIPTPSYPPFPSSSSQISTKSLSDFDSTIQNGFFLSTNSPLDEIKPVKSARQAKATLSKSKPSDLMVKSRPHNQIQVKIEPEEAPHNTQISWTLDNYSFMPSVNTPPNSQLLIAYNDDSLKEENENKTNMSLIEKKKKKSSYIRVSPFDRIIKRDIRRQIPYFFECILNGYDSNLVSQFVNDFFTKDFKHIQFFPFLLLQNHFPLVLSDNNDFSLLFRRLFYTSPDFCFRIVNSRIIRSLDRPGCEIFIDMSLKGTRTILLPEIFLNIKDMPNHLFKSTKNKANIVNFFNNAISSLDLENLKYTETAAVNSCSFDQLYKAIKSFNIFNGSTHSDSIHEDKLLSTYKASLIESIELLDSGRPNLLQEDKFSYIDIKATYKFTLDENHRISMIQSVIL